MQQAAHDLRWVISVAQITPVLERVADHVGNITDAAIKLNNEPQLANYFDLPRMAARASDMPGKTIETFTNEDLLLARHIIELEKEIDSICRIAKAQFIKYGGDDTVRKETE